MKRTLILLCLLLGSVMLGVALGIAWIFPQAHTARKVSTPARVTGTPTTASSIHYLYYALKSSQGFMLARAQKGTDGRPLGAPQPLTMIGDGFGQVESDSVATLQLSPDGRYLAIDGSRDHGDLVWIYDTQTATLKLVPHAVTGNFLHWMPGGHTFLYRPMFPAGPDAPMDNGIWNPGLWEVDAATDQHQNIDVGVPAAFLIDAAPSPDGSQIVYSTTGGLGKGSDTRLMNGDGHGQKLLFHTAESSQSIAGLFTWSPDGKSIAYERLSDSSTPFLPASLWLMDTHGEEQRRLVDNVDGGHGFALSWSPDSRKIAFVERTNIGDHQADMLPQALQCAVGVVKVDDGSTWQVASSQQTGKAWNINPSWTMDSSSIVFTALDPMNRVVGGTPRYWSARIVGPQEKPRTAPISESILHVVALELS